MLGCLEDPRVVADIANVHRGSIMRGWGYLGRGTIETSLAITLRAFA